MLGAELRAGPAPHKISGPSSCHGFIPLLSFYSDAVDAMKDSAGRARAYPLPYCLFIFKVTSLAVGLVAATGKLVEVLLVDSVPRDAPHLPVRVVRVVEFVSADVSRVPRFSANVATGPVMVSAEVPSVGHGGVYEESDEGKEGQLHLSYRGCCS